MAAVAAVAAVAQEFNAGDVGIAGGLQVLEPAVNHPTASETIKRSWDSFSMGLAKGSKGSKGSKGLWRPPWFGCLLGFDGNWTIILI